MASEVIVALIAGLGTLLGSLFGVLASSKLTNHRLLALEKKVDAHNHLVERMALAENSLKSVHKRVDKMEEKIFE
jgi:hypothetical protein